MGRREPLRRCEGGTLGYRYAVLGAGRQGVAAAWDLARHGEAEEIWLVDGDSDRAKQASERLEQMTGQTSGTPVFPALTVDATDAGALGRAIQGCQAVLSALPYQLNPLAARVAVAAGCSFNDLGGNTARSREILSLDEAARDAGVSVIPDCGLAPGMANVLAVIAMQRLGDPVEVKIWCGGLPRQPLPPLGYKILFSPAGLTNEYTREAVVLRHGRVTLLPPLTEREEVDFPSPAGRCEAFLTAGGSSTCPWTFEGCLETFEYRTVRYPGHLDRVRALADLGYFDESPIRVGGGSVSPREMTHVLLSTRLAFPDEPDLVVLRVRATGEKGGRTVAVQFDLLEHSDPATGLSAMERCTGLPAATVTWLQASGEIQPGARPQELAVPPERFLEEIRRRGLRLEESLTPVRPTRTPTREAVDD
jgi:lysine 6-dehydrogenase